MARIKGGEKEGRAGEPEQPDVKLELLTSTLAARLSQTPERNTIPLPLFLLRQPQLIPIERLLIPHRRVPIVPRHKMMQRFMQAQTRRVDVR